ncbi:MAG: helix-turn-helix transcriptional regulator [Oscillospiraceae bacterium]
MEKIGYRLRKARWLKNVSISKIAHYCQLDRKSIMNLELHNTDCYISTLYKICKYTGISADYLLGFSKEKFYNKDSNINNND